MGNFTHSITPLQAKSILRPTLTDRLSTRISPPRLRPSTSFVLPPSTHTNAMTPNKSRRVDAADRDPRLPRIRENGNGKITRDKEQESGGLHYAPSTLRLLRCHGSGSIMMPCKNLHMLAVAVLLVMAPASLGLAENASDEAQYRPEDCVVFNRISPANPAFSDVYNRCNESLSIRWKDAGHCGLLWAGCRLWLRPNQRVLLDPLQGPICFTAAVAPGSTPIPKCE